MPPQHCPQHRLPRTARWRHLACHAAREGGTWDLHSLHSQRRQPTHSTSQRCHSLVLGMSGTPPASFSRALRMSMITALPCGSWQARTSVEGQPVCRLSNKNTRKAQARGQHSLALQCAARRPASARGWGENHWLGGELWCQTAAAAREQASSPPLSSTGQTTCCSRDPATTHLRLHRRQRGGRGDVAGIAAQEAHTGLEQRGCQVVGCGREAGRGGVFPLCNQRGALSL